MKKKIKVVTTHTIENCEEYEYLDAITANVVVGMNVFKDFFSGFTDFFGGNSSSYENTIDKINAEVINNLKRKAYNLGANCILGLTIDNDEISAQGKSMMMVTAMGTAVKIKFKEKHNKVNLENKHFAITKEQLDFYQAKGNLSEKLESNNYGITEEDWKFIKTNSILDLAEQVLENVINKTKSNTYSGELVNNTSEYLQTLETDFVISLIYDAISKNQERIVLKVLLNLSKNLNLVDYKKLTELFKSDNFETKRASLEITCMRKMLYENDDLNYINELILTIPNSFVKLGTIAKKKVLLSSKEKDIWICQCQAENSQESKSCKVCNKDIYGFKNEDIKPSLAVEYLEKTLSILKENLR